MFSVACLCCYCCLVPSRRGGGAARTHCLSRDRAPVERVDQWGGGIAAAEARPSARVGGLVPARASLLGGGAPEPRGQPGNPRRNERCLRRFSSGLRFDANARLSLARVSLSSPLSLLFSSSRCPVGEHTRGDRLGRSWIPAQPWAGRASAPLRVEKDTWRGSSHVLGHAAIASSLSLFIGWEGLFWILLYIISPRVDGIHSSNVYFLRNISLL